MKIENRKARHDYEIIETLEVGVVLKGKEIVAIKHGQFDISRGYVTIAKDQMQLVNTYINNEESQSRQITLLAHRREIKKWDELMRLNRYTIVPLSAYMKDRRLKLEIALVRGKKKYDKRESLKQQSIARDNDRKFK